MEQHDHATAVQAGQEAQAQRMVRNTTTLDRLHCMATFRSLRRLRKREGGREGGGATGMYTSYAPRRAAPWAN